MLNLDSDKKERPLVSVIMTCYNRERFIAEAIYSILNQTYNNWELIIVDDGSKDNTAEIADKYTKEKNIKLIRNKENLGRSSSLNIGLSASNGKYICIQDSDDISLPNRIEIQAGILQKYQNCFIVSSQAEFFNINGNSFTVWPKDVSFQGMLPSRAVFNRLYFGDNFISLATAMMRRLPSCDYFFNTGFKHCVDLEFFLRASRRYSFYYIPYPLVKMRRGEGHDSMITKRDERFIIRKKVLQHIFKLNCKDKIMPVSFFDYRRAISNQLIRESSYYLDNSSKLKGKLIALQAMFYNPIDKRVLIFVIEHIFSKKILKLLAKIKHLLL